MAEAAALDFLFLQFYDLMLDLCPLLVHELKNWVFGARVSEDRAGNLDDVVSQIGRTALGNAAGVGAESAGLERQHVHICESHQSTLVGKVAHVVNLHHKLRSGDPARTVHHHDHIGFWQQGGETDHLTPQDMQYIIDGVQTELPPSSRQRNWV